MSFVTNFRFIDFRKQMPIRKVIELLCRMLDENGVCSVKAETLRKAKFNDVEVVPVLWKLVYSVLCYSNGIALPTTEIGIEDIDFTKTKLIEKQYFSNEMLNLPPDMSCGSRELLLAFGWIFCNDQLICRLIHARTNVFEDSDENLLSAFGIANDIPDAHQNKLQSLESDASDPYIKIKQLLILNNKLRLNLCNLYSFQREFYTLKHKIYEATFKDASEPNRNYLSVLELQLLKSPDKLKKYLDLLEKDNRCLENLLKWKDCQEVFWKWMGSVLDLKISQLPQSNQPIKTEAFSKVQFTASNRLSETCEDLEDLLGEYDGLLDQLQKLCLEKSDCIAVEELNSMVSSIEREIKKYKISSQNAKCLKQSPVFQLEAKTERKTTVEDEQNFLEVMKEGRLPDEFRSIDIQNETRKLKNEISHLEAYLIMQQNKLKAELDQLNAKMVGFYCIPPLRKSK